MNCLIMFLDLLSNVFILWKQYFLKYLEKKLKSNLII